jgi:cytoskeletal protein CcmA (bactofilin family)
LEDTKIMFRGNKPPVHEETEMIRSSAAPSNVNPAMVAQINKVTRHAEDIQKDAEPKSQTDKQLRKLTVGPGIRLKGEIADCDILVVEGHVEASAKAKLIEIAETGTIIGDIEVETADVSGRVDGSLNANERLIIRSTGRVSGKIRYDIIEIESGGRISGDVETEEEAKDSSPIVKGMNKPDSMAS